MHLLVKELAFQCLHLVFMGKTRRICPNQCIDKEKIIFTFSRVIKLNILVARIRNFHLKCTALVVDT